MQYAMKRIHLAITAVSPAPPEAVAQTAKPVANPGPRM
jgi:hypothetical protein